MWLRASRGKRAKHSRWHHRKLNNVRSKAVARMQATGWNPGFQADQPIVPGFPYAASGLRFPPGLKRLPTLALELEET